MTEFTFKLRRDTSWRWNIQNPVLSDGEPGFETDTGRFKIGDGSKRWVDLDYFVPVDPLDIEEPPPSDLLEHVNSLLPHPVYDEGVSFTLLYQNAKV
jgi:Major tropism determinant N-terminal domain